MPGKNGAGLAGGGADDAGVNGSGANIRGSRVREFPGEVTVLALGPRTKLASAVRLDDGFAAVAKERVFRGGSFSPHPAGNAAAPEYRFAPRLALNFRRDPEAAEITLHAPWRSLTQIPVDATTTLSTAAMIARVAAADTALARAVAKPAERFP